ncbi:hypothetical protein H6P81_005902 [Aristolochia fimbriata]|uniref:Uncharacterized protein n=1 Tax=Aristolochia fimbriata TaxID=158543 RepID=A0AAV7EW96_ARIFI|nr:hypothetical protein H6P81_005902 [Aristolochia fimbriata]
MAFQLTQSLPGPRHPPRPPGILPAPRHPPRPPASSPAPGILPWGSMLGRGRCRFDWFEVGFVCGDIVFRHEIRPKRRSAEDKKKKKKKNKKKRRKGLSGHACFETPPSVS